MLPHGPLAKSPVFNFFFSRGPDYSTWSSGNVAVTADKEANTPQIGKRSVTLESFVNDSSRIRNHSLIGMHNRQRLRLASG